MPKAKADAGEKKTKKATGKKEKDPNAPKKPLGAYMWFCADNREKLKKEFPDLKVTEMATKLGAAWKETDDKAREKYQKQAEKDKERYAKDMEAYQAE